MSSPRRASPSVSTVYWAWNQYAPPPSRSASSISMRCATGPKAATCAADRLRRPLQSSGGEAGGSPRSKYEQTGSHRPSQGSTSWGGPRLSWLPLLLTEYVSEQPTPSTLLSPGGVQAPQAF